jgi:TRAP-type uncharacterized transport system substrate-binding protein
VTDPGPRVSGVAAERRTLDAPHVERPVDLTFRGDWGLANMHRILSWLCGETVLRAPEGTRIAITNGWGMADNIDAVVQGHADVAVMTPATFARMALAGTGPFTGRAASGLRALGAVPHDDRLVLALRADFGIGTIGDLRAHPGVRIAGPPPRSGNLIGFAAVELLSRSDAGPEVLRAAGGAYLEQPFPSWFFDVVADGTADGIIYEAVMTEHWQHLFTDTEMVVVPFEDGVLEAVEADYGWRRAALPSGLLPGDPGTEGVLDFSDFLLICRADLPDDVAQLLAWELVATRATLEAQYRHLPPGRSAVAYPIDPAAVAATPIPLHEAAGAMFEQLGIPCR